MALGTKIVQNTCCDRPKAVAGTQVDAAADFFAIDYKRDILPAVVGGWGGWVAAVVRGYKKDIILPHRPHQFAELPVKISERLRVAIHIIAVPSALFP